MGKDAMGKNAMTDINAISVTHQRMDVSVEMTISVGPLLQDGAYYLVHDRQPRQVFWRLLEKMIHQLLALSTHRSPAETNLLNKQENIS